MAAGCRLNSPRAATRAGIAMIHQELSLVPELAVDENIFLGQEKRGGLFLVDRRRQIEAGASGTRAVGFSGADRSARKPATGRVNSSWWRSARRWYRRRGF